MASAGRAAWSVGPTDGSEIVGDRRDLVDEFRKARAHVAARSRFEADNASVLRDQAAEAVVLKLINPAAFRRQFSRRRKHQVFIGDIRQGPTKAILAHRGRFKPEAEMNSRDARHASME